LKQLFTILFFLLAFAFANGQSCETFNKKTINCIDKDSLKQGFWYEYKVQKILTTDSLRHNPRAIGFHNDEGKVHIPIAEGYYKDNKRIGQWIYYAGSFYNDNYANPTSHQKSITFTDSGYFYEVDTFWHYTAKVSNDTSFLTGTIILKNDTVQVICKDKKCYLYNSYKKKKEKFSYSKLESMISWLNFYGLKVKPKNMAANMGFSAVLAEEYVLIVSFAYQL
jgi:hypothetical protein